MKTFLSVFLVLLLITACASGPSKGQLDDEVRRLCAIDGGIKVYETVKLPAHKFGKGGSIYIPPKQLAKPEDEYFMEQSIKKLKKGNPELLQIHTKVYRKTDTKLLGEIIVYMRRGGGIIGPWHVPAFYCPSETSGHLKMQIFIKK